MKPAIPEIVRKEAAAYKALGHPTRLFIVHKLGKRDICVCELAEMAGVGISTVSEHLSILKRAGIIQSRREGTQVIYSLKFRCILEFSACAGFSGR